MQKQKFLFVSYSALIMDIAWHMVKEGQDVKFYIRDEEEKEVGDGFVPKTEDWEKEIEWADIIVFDDVLGMGEWAERCRKLGKKVVGGTVYTDKIEDDRSFGQEEMRKHGIPILPYWDYHDFETAIEFVKKNPGRYVIKPSGEAANMKNLLFIGEEEDGRDVLQVLEDYNKAWKKQIPVFQLQKRVVGVEVAVGAFFNGNEFIYPINVNFEHKKLFPTNIGPSTGEMGTTMFWSAPNKLFNSTLKKLEPTLAKEHYVGYIDINCIVNGNGIYPLEFTARFGYPTISIMKEGIQMPISEFFYNLASGVKFNIKVKPGFQIGVRIVVPPFPFTDDQTFKALSKDSIIHFTKPTEGIHIEDIKMENGEWLITGNTGVVMIVCGTGLTMKHAQAQAYSRIRSIIIPHMYYRDDIGERWFDDSDKLHAWGYLHEI